MMQPLCCIEQNSTQGHGILESRCPISLHSRPIRPRCFDRPPRRAATRRKNFGASRKTRAKCAISIATHSKYLRQEREQFRHAAEDARLAAEEARAAAETARNTAMESVRVCAESFQTTLEQLKALEEMRKTLNEIRDLRKRDVH